MISHDLFIWLTKASIAASVLALLVIGARKWLSRHIGARSVVLLWSIPALRLLMPPLPKFTTPAAPAESTEAAALPMVDMAALMAANAARPVTDVTAAPASGSFDISFLMPILLMVWAVGALVFLGRTILSTHRFQRMIEANAVGTPAAVRDLAQKAATEVGLRHLPNMVSTRAVETPQLAGFWRPVVILPAHFDETYTPYEQRYALLHELVHYRRKDIMSGWVAVALTAAQWFNPLAHRAFRLFRLDQEAACDEAVRALGIQSRDYAATLLKSAKVSMGPAPALSLNHGLVHRLKQMRAPMPSTLLLRTASIAIAAVAVASAASTASTFTIAPPADENDEPKKHIVIRKDVRTEDGQPTTLQDEENNVFIRKTGDNPQIVIRTESSKNVTLKDSGDDAKSMSIVVEPEASFVFKSEFVTDEDNGLYVIGNPFDVIPEPAIKNINIEIDMPIPPTPPEGPTAAPEAPKEVEGGKWVFIPDAPDMTEFEEGMKVFEAKMAEVEIDMQKFEDEMAAYGEKMGRVGEAFGDLVKECKAHQEKGNGPTILTTSNPEADEDIRVLCVPVGENAPTKAVMSKFIDAQRTLSKEEKAELKERGGWK